MISFEEYCNQYPQQMPLILSCSDPHLHPLLNHCCFHSLLHCHSLIFNSKKINLNPISDFEKSPFLSSMAVHLPKKSLSMKVNLLNKIQLLLNQTQKWKKKEKEIGQSDIHQSKVLVQSFSINQFLEGAHHKNFMTWFEKG